MHMLVNLVWPSCVWMLVAGEALVCVPVWCMDVCRNVDSFPFRREFWHYAFFLVLFLGKVMPIFFLVLKYSFALPRRRPWSAR